MFLALKGRHLTARGGAPGIGEISFILRVALKGRDLILNRVDVERNGAMR